jgi:hypothetical protein
LMICLDNDAFLETKGIFRLYKPKNNEWMNIVIRVSNVKDIN